MKAKKILAVGLTTVALGVWTAAWAQHDHGSHGQQPSQPVQPSPKEEGKSMSFQGELVDMACYVAHEGKGAKHKSCAQSCIRDGAPMGILTANEELVLLVEDHDAKKPYVALKEKAGEQVKVTGTFFERGGLPALVVKSVDGAK